MIKLLRKELDAVLILFHLAKKIKIVDNQSVLSENYSLSELLLSLVLQLCFHESWSINICKKL